mgnify:CR=1 FL=1
MQPKDRKDLTRNFKDVVFASVSGSDVRRKLGRSIATSVVFDVRKWDTLRASIFLVIPHKSHHVLLVCTVISDPVTQGRLPTAECPRDRQVVLTD